MITNGEFTKLNYLCIHLARNPNEWKRMFSIIEHGKFSTQAQDALSLFREELNKLSAPSLKDLREISERFIKFGDNNVSDMGRSISIGIDWWNGTVGK